MYPSFELSDGYYAGSLADQAEQDRLKALLDEITVTLQEGEVLDHAHMDALREIAGVAGLEVHVNIGRGRRVGRGVEGYCYYESE